MKRFDRHKKHLSAAVIAILMTLFVLQGCAGPLSIIGDIRGLSRSETTEGKEAESPPSEDAESAEKDSAEQAEPVEQTESAAQDESAEQDETAEQAQAKAQDDTAEQEQTAEQAKAAEQDETAEQADSPQAAGTGQDETEGSKASDIFSAHTAFSEVVSKETFDSELEKEIAAYGTRSFLASLVTWQGKAAAVDEPQGTVYIPCAPTGGEYADWAAIVAKLAPASRDEKILYLKEDKMEQIADAVREGYSFEALLCSQNGVARFRVVLTGLPVLSISKTDFSAVIGKEDHTGCATMIDTTGLLQSSDCTFHVRGNYASYFDKKPYKISLKKKNGKQNKISWLGMRKDDDWILNPLYTDMSRVREMTAYSLWEQVSVLAQKGCPSSRVKYVEVLMDNAYHGIYALTEPVDAKQLKESKSANQISFTENDILYKINMWDKDSPYLDAYGSSAGLIEIKSEYDKVCVEIRYPKEWENNTTWDPMYFFHDFAFRSKSLETLEAAGIELDRDSVVTLSLFCGLTHATDNTWKNTLLIAHRKTAAEGDGGADAADSGWVLYRDIWDLNYVFGDIYDGSEAQRYTVFTMDEAQQYRSFADTTYDYETLVKADPSMSGALAEKWAQWRDSGISAESVCETAQSSYSQLTDSGALEREMIRWPQAKDPGAAVEEMKEWIKVRFAYLDEKFTYERGADSGNENEE